MRFETPAEPSAREAEDAEEEDIVTEVQQWFEQLKQSIREQGLEEGLKEGHIKALARQFEKKLGRPLTEPERSTLAERFDLLGPDRLDDVRVELSADALAAWLADPAAR